MFVLSAGTRCTDPHRAEDGINGADLGTFSSFLFSIAGSLLSFLCMYGLLRIGRGRFSMIGISLIGGVTHNIGQLGAAYDRLRDGEDLLLLAVFDDRGHHYGHLRGLCRRYLIQRLERIPAFEELRYS